MSGTKQKSGYIAHVRENTRRYIVGTGGPGCIVDVRAVGGFLAGTIGPGAVHHVAFEVQSDPTELEMRERVTGAGLHPTHVYDRMYFHSVYFREPGGVLFEVATTGPGFAVDEDPANLGTALKLPPWEEADRSAIEAGLAPVVVR